jgi:hypothetical protein
MPYNTIPDAEIDPDSPVTASLMQKLRDNPIGIAQAAAGAPKVQYNALNGSGITHAYSTGATINFAPFAHTPTGTVTHLIFVFHEETGGEGSYTTLETRVDGALLFNVVAGTTSNYTKSVFEMRSHITTNEAHAFSFVHSTPSGSARITIVSFPS